MMTGIAVSGMMLTLASASMAMSAMDRMFTTKAAQGGLAEVKTSKMAMRKTHNRHVLMVARRMVKEHSAANAELKDVVKRKGMALPSDTDPKHRAALARLSRLSGTAFDKAYMAGQEKDHAATVKLFQNEIVYGQDRDVSAFASKNLPTIQDHTRMIFQVGSNLGVHSAVMPKLKPAMMPSSMGGRHM